MHDPNRPDFEMLNAYVDGELPADIAAAVAQSLVREPALAEAVAKLHRLKASVSEMVPDLVYAPITATPFATSRGRFVRSLAASAALMIAAAGTAVWLTSAASGPEALVQAGSPHAFVARHDAWVATSGSWMPASDDAEPAAPVLAAAGLARVLSESSTTADGATVRHQAYLGKNGCRLSLFSIAGHEGASGTSLPAESGLLSATWRSSATRFVLIARHMDEARFAIIAEALQSLGSESIPRPDLIARLSSERSVCLA